ncbi:hypothetical protein MOD12_21805, partial [Bacillus atrophaeus]|nr:hypothetical protein [Bacillus atrophaeus]
MTTSEPQSYEFNTNLAPLDSLFFNDLFNGISYDKVKSWLKDHNAYNKQIRDASKLLYNANGVYRNVIDYMVALPTLDRVILGSSKAVNFNTNKQKFSLALRKINDKSVVRDSLGKLSKYGTGFFYFDSVVNDSFPATLNDNEVGSITETNTIDDFNCSILSVVCFNSFAMQ